MLYVVGTTIDLTYLNNKVEAKSDDYQFKAIAVDSEGTKFKFMPKLQIPVAAV